MDLNGTFSSAKSIGGPPSSAGYLVIQFGDGNSLGSFSSLKCIGGSSIIATIFRVFCLVYCISTDARVLRSPEFLSESFLPFPSSKSLILWRRLLWGIIFSSPDNTELAVLCSIWLAVQFYYVVDVGLEIVTISLCTSGCYLRLERLRNQDIFQLWLYYWC